MLFCPCDVDVDPMKATLPMFAVISAHEPTFADTQTLKYTQTATQTATHIATPTMVTKIIKKEG